MKRLSTSLLIFILALLALPERAWAWSDLRLRSTIYNNWDTSYSSGTTDESSFNKVDNDVNKWTKTIDATSIKADIYFRLYTTDDYGKEVQPSEDNTDITNKGVYSSAEFVKGKGSKSFRLLQSTNHYDTYTIDAEYTDNKWNITVTATKGGSSDPVSTYKLMMGNGTDEGTQVATFTGTGFPYTATYNIGAAGTYYFYVNDGAKNYFHTNQEITTDGGFATIYQYNDNYFNHVVKLQAPRAGEYTFKFNHVEGTKYTLQCNFPSETTPTPTPILGNNFYLVGDFLNTDKSINYDCRYFKLSETAAATAARDGVEEYSINIPTTLAVNVQILATDEKGSTALYGPSGEVTINKTNPSGSSSTTGELVAATKTPTNYFKFEDRTTGRTTETPDANDGLYTITVTVTNGVPTNYTITHNPLTRVAYYLPNTSDASVKESLNSRSENTAAFNNVFFGRVYLPKGVACYVLSNYLGNYDSNAKTDTKKKLYLQGNRSGGNPDTQEGERNDYTKVYPIIDNNGNPTDAKPFVFSTTDIVAMNLEYAPRRGHGDYKAEGITGEVLRSQKTTQAEDGSSIDVPTITELRMVGPAVGDDTWDYNKGVVMDYNMAEQCWEATINTTAAAGAKFRFVANDTWKNSWQENGTEATDKAKIPYDGKGDGHAATPADPNEVSYISLESSEDRKEEYDIIFNRAPGKWRVRFYFTSKQIGTGDTYEYIFKYTINGYKSVLRTYCSSVAQKPKADSNIKVYGAYAFDGDPVKKSGKIKLYEMNYIPANEGVILYSSNTIDEATIETVMESYNPLEEGKTMYKKISDDKYKNYLVGTIDNTTVYASVFDGNERTHRNFFFNYLKNSGFYKEGDTDYLGFFRIKSGSTCKANHAYLSLPTSVLTWNGQILEQVMKEYEENGVQAELTKGMRIVFSDGSDWVEDVPTSITTIKDKNRVFDNYYYTLQGVRVEKPLKGIYIHNGKKVVIK